MTLVSRTLRTSSRSVVVGSWIHSADIAPEMPALLTRASSRPVRRSTSSAAAVTLWSLVTSSGTPKASTPTARSFSTAVSRRASSRAPTATP